MKSSTSYFADAKDSIVHLLQQWGKRAIYRYLRDHDLLEEFVDQLPLKSFMDTDQKVLQDTLISTWDDYSAKAYDKLRKYQEETYGSALGYRLACYAIELNHQGFKQASLQILKCAEKIDSEQVKNTVDKKASALTKGDILVGINEKYGFGKSAKSAKSAKVVTATVSNKQVHAQAVADDQTYSFKMNADDNVTVVMTTKPRYSKALQYAALAKLVEVEDIVPADMQARVARIRDLLEKKILSEST